MTRTRILVADPLPIFRSGVRRLLDRESDFEVIEASNLAQLVRSLADGCPDVALIDLDLPPLGGVAAIEHVGARCQTHMVVWSFDPAPQTVLDAVRAGASGYLHKEIAPQGLVRSLRGIVRGEAALARDLACRMIEALHRLEKTQRARERAAALSVREREVLSLVAGGARNRQVATALTISEFTVKRHMQNILEKLGVPSRRAAAALYRSAYGRNGSAEIARTSA